MDIINNLRNFEVEDDILKLVNKLDEIQKEFNIVFKKYSEDFSTADKKQQDILHYIEFNNFSSVVGFRLSKELQDIRKERRKAEDSIEILRHLSLKYNLCQNKNMSETLKNKKEAMKKRIYKTRVYNEEKFTKLTRVRVNEEVK